MLRQAFKAAGAAARAQELHPTACDPLLFTSFATPCKFAGVALYEGCEKVRLAYIQRL